MRTRFDAVEKICKGAGLTPLYYEGDDISVIAQIIMIPNYLKDTDDDDSLFLILYVAGYVQFSDDDPFEFERKRTLWAIQKAEEVGLWISKKVEDDIQSDLDNIDEGRYSYDFSSIGKERTLRQIIDLFGLPVAVKKNSYWGDFYIVIEGTYKNGRAYGTAYKGGKIHSKQNYTYYLKDYYWPIDSETREFLGYGDTLTNDADEDKKYNQHIKERIKKNDTFDEYDTNIDFLFNHQRAGCLLARRYDKFAFFYDTGTGKTIMTLAVINEKYEKEKAQFMIVAPKAIIKTAWMEDARERFPHMRIFPLSNNFSWQDYRELYEHWERNSKISKGDKISSKEWDELFSEDGYWKWNSIKKRMIALAHHYVINIEKYRYDVDTYIKNFPRDGMIIDESAILKNPHSKSSKTMLDAGKNYRYVYLLSGKPAPNNSTEYYTQMKMVDPITFHMTFNSYVQKFFTGQGSKCEFASPVAENYVADMISKRSLIVSKEDCLNLPNVMYEQNILSLSNQAMEYYEQMFKGCLSAIIQQEAEYKKRQVFYASRCKLAIMTKLRELASGFFIDEYGVTVDIHDTKLKEVCRIVENHPDEPVLIWCQFTHEIDTLKKCLSKYGRVVDACGKSTNIDQNIDDFKHGRARFMLAHPKSIKYGVTFTNCCIAIYYSLSYSAEDYYQSRDRIYRLGQKRDCTYHFLIAKDTIDEIMLDCINNKMNYAEIFQVIIKQAAKHGINYEEFKNQEVLEERKATEASKKVVKEYDFKLTEENIFEYKYEGEVQTAQLYNTMLSLQKIHTPEEMLFEIGKDILCSDKTSITYEDIKNVSAWVLSEFKRLKLKIINRVNEYLEEQIAKQSEIDIAQGLSVNSEHSTPFVPLKVKQNQESKTKVGIGVLKRWVAQKTIKQVKRDLYNIYFREKYVLTHDCYCGDNSIAHAHLDTKTVFMPRKDFEQMGVETLFDFLHEIGHLETNKDGMTRQEEEYYATTWAIDRMTKVYGFTLPESRKQDFERYISGYSSRNNKILKIKDLSEIDWKD